MPTPRKNTEANALIRENDRRRMCVVSPVRASVAFGSELSDVVFG